MRVPLNKQRSELTYGPAALKMVLKYFGKDISEKEIIKKTGGIKKYGIRTIKLAEYARNLGFQVECYSFNQKLAKNKAIIKKPQSSYILKFLKMKIPIIIAVRSTLLYNKKPSDMGHFIVITDFNDGIYRYNDPTDGKNHKIKEDDLLFAWFNNILDSSAYLLAIYKQI